tara:strand:+ start:4224 stop:4391 length:168 start_codon:yes stop_codon:yes gene_type:complete
MTEENEYFRYCDLQLTRRVLRTLINCDTKKHIEKSIKVIGSELNSFDQKHKDRFK